MVKPSKIKRHQIHLNRLKLYGVKTNAELKAFLQKNPISILDPILTPKSTIKVKNPETILLMELKIPVKEKTQKERIPKLENDNLQQKCDNMMKKMFHNDQKTTIKNIDTLMKVKAGWLPETKIKLV